MNIPLKYGPIASWWLEGRSQLVWEGSEKSAMASLSNMIQATALIFESAYLLRPINVVLEDWIKFDSKKERVIQIKKPNLSLRIEKGQQAKYLADIILKKLDSVFTHGKYLYPLKVSITGDGVILNAKGNEIWESNVVWFQAITFGTHIINVCTQSDVWMPYDLKGNSQPMIHRKNAPRLESTLKRLSKQLEIESIVEGESDYAIVEGFRVSNRVDIDGDLVSIKLR